MSEYSGVSRVCAAVFSITVAVAGALTVPVKPVQAVTSLELGIFQPGAAWDVSVLAPTESLVGAKFASVKWYQDWDTAFDTSVPTRLRNAGYLPELTWQPIIGGVGVSYPAIAAGDHDAYITSTANAVKNSGPIRISFAAEMNGNWSKYYVGKSSPADFVAAWRRVVGIFNTQGATNVQWVWTPNVHYYGEEYAYATFYPGDAYVTYLGLDGYNWGTSQSWSIWQTFSQVFDSSYRSLTELSSKQILIGETASAEQGGSKADWISDMFAVIPVKYPRIKGITWFNENKETDWRIQSSAAASTAFRNGIAGTVSQPASTPTPTATASPTVKPSEKAKKKGATAPTAAPATGTETPPVVESTPTATSTEVVAVETQVTSFESLETPLSQERKKLSMRSLLGAAIPSDPQDQLALILFGEIVLILFFFSFSRRSTHDEVTVASPLVTT